MDITITPDTYTPSVDNDGNYIDKIPIIKKGLFCPCGSRKEKNYENATKFASHIKSKSHQNWLLNLNQNKSQSQNQKKKNQKKKNQKRKRRTRTSKENN
jgi:hypothetical protein